ncbi:tRNA lysidine(34) synthetase TilS [Kangiella japonica]|uniref:tRNA(Ile)-lysidine synthase n=1 Tax=Kangiella japonica TaxID=647384 RepID=A0ABN0SU57_9GAMM
MSKQEPVSVAISTFLAQFISQKNSSKASNADHSQTFTIALSGGADSVALLHAISSQYPKDKLKAIYINHQLQAVSDEWADFCQSWCQELGVDFEVIAVEVDQKAASLENSARKARYQAFSKVIDSGQCLLTGHHQDDQAETLLLQLFRGAGPKGLSAMPYITSFAEGYHARPLLSVSKAEVLEYCKEHQLSFVDDPSNLDTQHRRNFVRHRVIPLLEQEWPQLTTTLSRVSQLQADTQVIVEERAQEDWEACYTEGKGLSVEGLKKLSEVRQNSLIRYWFEKLGLGMPSVKVLEQLLSQMLEAETDAQPMIEFKQGSLRRHQDHLVWLSQHSSSNFKELEDTTWDGKKDLQVADGITITAEWLETHYPELIGENLVVSLRRGGERFRKKNARQSTSLKNYFQEQKFPAWQRDVLLLIKLNDEVRAVYAEHLKDSL